MTAVRIGKACLGCQAATRITRGLPLCKGCRVRAWAIFRAEHSPLDADWIPESNRFFGRPARVAEALAMGMLPPLMPQGVEHTPIPMAVRRQMVDRSAADEPNEEGLYETCNPHLRAAPARETKSSSREALPPGWRSTRARSRGPRGPFSPSDHTKRLA